MALGGVDYDIASVEQGDEQARILSELVQRLQMENAELRSQLQRVRAGMQRIIDNLNADRPKQPPYFEYERTFR